MPRTLGASRLNSTGVPALSPARSESGRVSGNVTGSLPEKLTRPTLVPKNIPQAEQVRRFLQARSAYGDQLLLAQLIIHETGGQGNARSVYEQNTGERELSVNVLVLRGQALVKSERRQLANLIFPGIFDEGDRT